MPSISQIASSTLAVAAILFMHGASAAAIPGDAAAVDAETPSGPAAPGAARPEIDPKVLEEIFGPPPTTDAEKYKVNKSFQDYLEEVFGKPPADGSSGAPAPGAPAGGAGTNEEEPADQEGIANRPGGDEEEDPLDGKAPFEIANRPGE